MQREIFYLGKEYQENQKSSLLHVFGYRQGLDRGLLEMLCPHK